MKSFTFLFLLIEWLIFLSVRKVFVKILEHFVKIVVMKLTFFVIIVQAFTADKINNTLMKLGPLLRMVCIIDEKYLKLSL